MSDHHSAPAVAFLKTLRRLGPWNLTAIVPDAGHPESATFTDSADAARWIGARAGKANLYYMPNPAPNPTGRAGRANKQDVTAADFVHVDLDLDKLDDSRPLQQRKDDTVAALGRCDDPGPPTLVIDTGGGLQALWRIEGSMPTAEAERANRHVIETLGGDPGTGDIGRLLRLPGTVNLPDARKRERGRVPAPARLVSEGGASYEAYQFSLATARAERPAVDVEFDAPEEDVDLDALTSRYNLSDDLVTIISEGRLPTRKKGDDSRSAWLFHAACELVRHRVPSETVLGILLDDRFGIAESVLQKPDPDRYAERQVRQALSHNVDKVEFDGLEEAYGAEDDDAVRGNEQRQRRFARIGIDEMESLPTPEWLVDGWITEFALAQVYGARKKGKTFAVLDLALRVALGLDWHGHNVKRKRVTYVIAEGSLGRFFDRIIAWCLANKIDRYGLRDWFDVVGVRVGVDNPTDIKDYLAADLGPTGLTIIDTVARNMDGDENLTPDMNRFVKGADRIREHYRCAVILVHHSGKDKGYLGAQLRVWKLSRSGMDAAASAIG